MLVVESERDMATHLTFNDRRDLKRFMDIVNAVRVPALSGNYLQWLTVEVAGDEFELMEIEVIEDESLASAQTRAPAPPPPQIWHEE